MATKTAVKSAPVKKAGAKEEKKATTKLSDTKKESTTSKKKVETKKVETKKVETPTSKTKKVRVDTSKPVQVILPKKDSASGKTAYHVSKRDNDGREWKVFIQGSSKVIKLFPTQKEALDYAKDLCDKKDDGSYILLHGLDGKIRKF